MTDNDAAFNFNAKKGFLTFAHANFHPRDFITWLDSKRKLLRAVGNIELHDAREEHITAEAPTGELPHVHVVFEFERKLHTSDPRYFDYDGFHPKIETVRIWQAAVNYLREKDEDGNEYNIEIEYFNCDPDTADLAFSGTSPASGRNIDYVDIVRNCGSFDEWVNFSLNHHMSWGSALAMWDFFRGSVRDLLTISTAPGIAFPENTITDEAAAARDKLAELAWPEEYAEHRSIVLVGPSSAGKTVWALNSAPLPALFVRHIDDLRYFDQTLHRSIIFDDVQAAHLPLQTQRMLLDVAQPQAIHMRHKVAHIPAGITKLFTAADAVPFLDNVQLKRRMHLIWLHEDEPWYDHGRH
jgi:hypothetical protein